MSVILLLVTNRKSYAVLQFVPTTVSLNGVMARILLYFIEIDSFADYYVTVIEDGPILFVQCCLLFYATLGEPCSAVSVR